MEKGKEGNRGSKGLGRFLLLILSFSQRAQGLSCHVGGGESFSKVIGIIITTLTARMEKKLAGRVCAHELSLALLEVSHPETVTEDYIL